MFYNAKNRRNVKQLGQWTIHTSKEEPAKVHKIHVDVHTPAKSDTAENSSAPTSTAVRSRTATKVVSGMETGENDIEINIGEINLHLSYLNRNLMEISRSKENPMTQKEMLRNVRALDSMCTKLGACCSTMESILNRSVEQQTAAKEKAINSPSTREKYMDDSEVQLQNAF